MISNPARPAPGTLLARVAALPDPGAIALDFAEGQARFSLILARRGEEVFAYENLCPHAGYPLELLDGRVIVQEARYIVCPVHGASFRIENGACAGGPCDGDGLSGIAVEIIDGDVLIARALSREG